MQTPVLEFDAGDAPLLKRGDKNYDRAVATENLLYRFSLPDFVVQPETVEHVQHVIKQARADKIHITIKNGGHSYSGSSTAHRGILLDLSRMKRVELDMEAGIATLQGGAQWGNVYKQLVINRHDGYVVNGGRCPTVGVSGFILGGGLSPFTRSFGMGCDTLKQATIVTADGEVVTVKEIDEKDTNERKLFWALCGAGGGNFGVVVEMKLELKRLDSKEVVAGRFLWYPKPEPREEMEKFMMTMHDFYTAEWPDRTTIDSSWVCDLDDKSSSPFFVRFLVYHNGGKKDFERVIDQNITNTDLAKPLKLRTLEEKSSRFLHETLVAQWSEETKKSLPSTGRSYSIYTSFVLQNDKKTVDHFTHTIKTEMAEFRNRFKGEKGILQVTWIHAGGEANRKDSSETAYPWRNCAYHTYIMISWTEKWLKREMEGFMKRMEKSLRKFSINRKAAFINFPDKELLRSDYEEAYFGDNSRELRKIKKTWDKDNFFNWAQGVRVAAPKKKLGQIAIQAELPKWTRPSNELDVVPIARMAARNVIDDQGSGSDEWVEDYGDEVGMTEEEEWDNVQLTGNNEFEGGIYSLDDLGF